MLAAFCAMVAIGMAPTHTPVIAAENSETNPRLELVQCANLVYAGSKSSRCFSDKFMRELSDITFIDADAAFTPVKAGTDELFNYPFSIMTGEGNFSLFEEERKNIKSYLERGGFLLASAGCSSPEWDRSFRREFKLMYPDTELKKIPMEHALFQSVYDVKRIRLKNGGTTLLEGFELNGKIVLIYSSEGLNDVPSVQGCCCCGGNEIQNSKEINSNIIAYALTH
ncbi:MAG: DUF4159 domain-containing protein [Candidatus Hydrogenedentes bacterium]|nr:DUF4159 domain-containing protein [Candidatus Hydrogenedentota bacterium]